MEDTITLEEEDANNQDFNIPKDHGHLARNSLMKNHNAGYEGLSHLCLFPNSAII